ncbi:MAG: GAF domain-containing protein [Spirochaetaceae bacterium]
MGVPVSSTSKPDIPAEFEQKWQEIVTLAARIVKVPAGLIMRLHEKEIEVFSSSNTDGNPYEESERVELGFGLYCETVVGRREELCVPNALEDSAWEKNPDVALNMLSYFGVPIRWPDGEVFGTFCVLDSKRNEYDEDQKHLVHRLAELVESDLGSLVNMSERLAQAELQAKEIRHRITNQFNLLISYIDLHSSFGATSTDHQSVVQAVRARISTLSRLHHQMSTLKPGAPAPVLRSLREIAMLLVESAPFEIGVAARGDELFVDERIVVTLASILNELITNSIKHAFDGVPEPMVTIAVGKQDGGICIEYSDNGAASTGSTGEGGGLGSMIVAGLVAQLSGDVEQTGYRYRFRIPNEVVARTSIACNAGAD